MKLAKALLTSLAILTATATYAQDTTPDGLFKTAREAAYKQQFEEAIRLGKKALEAAPRYTDIVVFVGRVYSWNKQPDSAREYFQRALEQNEWYEDAYVAYTDVEYWNNNNDVALLIADNGLAHFPSSQELYLRKARIFGAVKDYNTAIAVTDTILTMDRHNTEARKLNLELKDASYRNRFTIRHDHAHFDKQFPDDWYFGSIEYTRSGGAVPFSARINYADRFKMDQLQYEGDAYPRISKTFYVYANLGFANTTDVFPKWRSAVSLIANLKHGYELEAGGRYLKYSNDIFFYTGYAGKYFGNFLAGYRTYITPTKGNISNSNSLSLRYYYGGKDDNITLIGTQGISPDDRRLNLQANSNAQLKNYMGEIVFRKSIRKLNIVGANFSWLHQEYLPDTWGNQFQWGVFYTRRF